MMPIDADLGAEMLLISSNGAERLGCRLEQHCVDNRFVLIRHGSDRRWQREHDMEVLDWQQIGLPRFQPRMRRTGLALRTMPVATTVVCDLLISTVVAAFDMPAQGCRPAGTNRSHDLELAKAQMPSMLLAIGIAVATENIRHLEHRL
jgi:hypothetical protein